MGEKLGVAYRREAVDCVVAQHFQKANRPLRFCHPRDLILQMRNYCKYHNRPPEMTDELFDQAVENYFVIM